MRTLAHLVQAELLGVPPATKDQPTKGSLMESHHRRDEGRRSQLWWDEGGVWDIASPLVPWTDPCGMCGGCGRHVRVFNVSWFSARSFPTL